MIRQRQEWTIFAVLVGVVIIILATAPTSGDFWWSDAPRHALNGAFVKDFIEAHPIHEAKAWAINYYLQYPALTILFYPPLFYVIEAGVFAIAGVNNFAAQATVVAFILLLGEASYGLARFVLPRWPSLAVALLAMGAPSVCFWGRQVMLDVPAYACIVLASFFLARYLANGRDRDIYLAVVVTLAAVYVRLNSVFVIPVFLVTLLAAKGARTLFDRTVIVAGLVGALGIIPCVILTWLFGKTNIESVAGVGPDLPRNSIAAWTFYPSWLPHAVGYVTAGLAVVGLVLLVTRRLRIERWYAWLILSWLTFGYLFISAINHREERYLIPIMFPFAVLAVVAIQRLLPRGAPVVAPAVAIVMLGYNLFNYRTPYVTGYARIAEYVARHAPPHAVVLFSGYRDGNFVFNLRTHEERRDVRTIRATKLLMSVSAGDPSRGLWQHDYSTEQIAALLHDLGVGLVVYQPGFWDDLREMALLGKVIHSPDFQRIAEFNITGATNSDEHTIEIYRPTYEVPQSRTTLQYDMPMIGQQFTGSISK